MSAMTPCHALFLCACVWAITTDSLRAAAVDPLASAVSELEADVTRLTNVMEEEENPGIGSAIKDTLWDTPTKYWTGEGADAIVDTAAAAKDVVYDTPVDYWSGEGADAIVDTAAAAKDVVWDTPVNYWSNEGLDALAATAATAKDVVWDTPVQYWSSATGCAYCNAWYKNDHQIDHFNFLRRLPDCPCNDRQLAVASATMRQYRGVGWVVDLGCTEGDCPFHPGAHNCYRSESRSPHAQQCCYNKAGVIMTTGFAAGTPDRGQTVSYKFVYQAKQWVVPDDVAANLKRLGSHVTHDVLSWSACCKYCHDSCQSCAKYYTARKPNQGAQDDGTACDAVDASSERDCSLVN